MKTRTLALVLTAAAACRSGGSSNNPDAGSGTDSPDGMINSDDVSIYDVQNPDNRVAVGALINVRGVVVTAIDSYQDGTGNKGGAFWVEEPGGGAYSGVEIFKADVAQVATLAVGDLVDITGGQKDEFALATDTSGRKTTEIDPPKGGALVVTKTGTGTPIEPNDVDALAIGKLATQDLRDAEWEKWEGVLIRVKSITAFNTPSPVSSSTPDPTFVKFNVTGPLGVESSLADFSGLTFKQSDCLASITGIGDYFFDWLLEPRAATDIVTGGTGCPAAEADATACADTIDDDANGFADCQDRSCQAAVASCVQQTSVVAVQNATVAPNSAVKFSGVVVTAIDAKRQNFWIQDKASAAVYNGVFVFRGFGATTALDASIQIGTVVDINSAVTSEFTTTGSTDLTTEVKGVSAAAPLVVAASTPASTATPAVLTPVTIDNVVGTTSEQYEGVLVELKNVKVFETTGLGMGEWSVGDANQKLIVGNDAVTITPAAVGTCLASLRGVMHFNTTKNQGHIKLVPTVAGDVATGGTCN